jgi:hypothetical protein
MKRCIINGAIGHWYPKGQLRLKKSLDKYAPGIDQLLFDKFPATDYDTSNPYNIKAACFEQAIALGYEQILWLDCSAWAIRSIEPIFQRITERGFYLASSGYSAGETCTDKLLEYHKITRDEAMPIPDSATGTIGVDLTCIKAKQFIYDFIEYAMDGMFAGNRVHDKRDSQDPRFKFSRQDQSVASLLAYKYKLTPLDELGGLTTYNYHRTPTACIVYQGM